VFAELNLSFAVGDDSAAVQANWRRVSAGIDGALRFMRMRQVHGNTVVVVNRDTPQVGAADALLTADSGLALCVLTADCVSLLLVAPDFHVVAAVHAGWRGTIAGVAAHAVHAVTRLTGARPGDIRVAMGPAIGGCCYEVDAGIADQLQSRWGAMPGAVTGDAGADAKVRLDLRRANATILTQLGVRAAEITTVGPCTRCAAAEYFSYRAAAHGITGRQLSFIAWRSADLER